MSEKMTTLTSSVMTASNKPSESVVRDLTPSHQFSPPAKSQLEPKILIKSFNDTIKDLKDLHDKYYQAKAVIDKKLDNIATLSQSRYRNPIFTSILPIFNSLRPRICLIPKLLIQKC